MKHKRDNRHRSSPPAASPALSGTAGRRWWLAGVILAVLAIAVYLPSLNGHLLEWDDEQYVGTNYHVHDLSWATVQWAFTSTQFAGNWHPLTWLSHALDIKVYGLSPGGLEPANLWGHHLTNLLLHAANAVLVLLLFRGLTGRFWPSLVAAAIFALHPLRVECVAWIAERKELLCTFFTLLTLLAYLRYAAKASLWRYALVFLALAAALASKPMAVTVPLVLLLLDFWPLKRLSWRAVAEKLPLAALAAGCCVVTMTAHAGYVAQYTLGERLGNAVISYAAYLGKLFWPAPGMLIPLYVHQGEIPGGLALWRIAVAAAILAVVTALAFSQWRRRPWLLVGWLWFVVTLGPVSGLVQVGSQGLADRYTYATMFALVLAVVLLAAEAVDRVAKLRYPAVAAAALVVAALSLLTWQQEPVWGNSLALWQYSAAHEPQSKMARSYLWNAEGKQLADRKDLPGAIHKFREVLTQDPDNPLALANLGACLGRTGQTREAIAPLRRVVALEPGDPKTRCNLGLALLAEPGGRDEAIAQFQAALAIDPGRVQALAGLAEAEMAQGRPAEAVTYWRRVAVITPLAPFMHAELGIALHRSGHSSEAAAELRQALALDPKLYPAKAELDQILSEQGQRKPPLGN